MPPAGGSNSGASGDHANPDMRIDASPEKRFFVELLIKDIDLLPAVVDLVDNSVDGARRLRPDGRFDGLEVAITANPQHFEIVDNCGGIEADLARHYAFRFGRPADFHGVPRSVGEFGIGMKRALFKLGREFLIDSKAPSSSFAILIDVEEWEADPSPEWSFRFTEVDDNYQPSSPADLGTSIRVEELHPNVSEDFKTPRTLAELRIDLRLRHQVALSSDMTIRLNGEALRPHRPALLVSDEVLPIRRQMDITDNGSTVQLALAAGVVGASDHEDEDRDEGRAEDFKTPGEAGWYLFCNDRLLFAADKTALTGWGTAGPAYHPQYRRFRGYAYLWADDAALLPWNTTKTGVDQDSRVWRRVQQEMFTALRGVMPIMNRVKAERQQSAPENRPLAAALQRAKPVPVAELPPSTNMRAPSPPRTPASTDQRIVYTVSRDAYQKVREALEASSAAEVGRRTFDYYLEHEVID
jgi:hypothetical protein